MKIFDEFFGESKSHIMTLDFETGPKSLRDCLTKRLIKEFEIIYSIRFTTAIIPNEHRMFFEVLTRNAPNSDMHLDEEKGVFQLTIDANAVIETALTAFKAGRYFVFLDGQQVEDPETMFHVTETSELTFMKLRHT